MTASEMARALLLAIDPAAVLNLPTPHPGQQRIIAEAQRFNVIAAGRRWGQEHTRGGPRHSAGAPGEAGRVVQPDVQDSE